MALKEGTGVKTSSPAAHLWPAGPFCVIRCVIVYHHLCIQRFCVFKRWPKRLEEIQMILIYSTWIIKALSLLNYSFTCKYDCKCNSNNPKLSKLEWSSVGKIYRVRVLCGGQASKNIRNIFHAYTSFLYDIQSLTCSAPTNNFYH